MEKKKVKMNIEEEREKKENEKKTPNLVNV